MTKRRGVGLAWLGLASGLLDACRSDGGTTAVPPPDGTALVVRDATADSSAAAPDAGTDAGATALDLGASPRDAGFGLQDLGSPSRDVIGDAAPYPVMSGPRDWSAHPAIVSLDRPADAPVYAVSDVHGGYDRLIALLSRHGVIMGAPTDPTSARWSAGHAVLVVTGDMIDKGPSSLEVIDLLRALEASASAAGGRVVASLGNHEAEFLVDPLNTRADARDGIDPELRTLHLDPMVIASGTDPRGRWLREAPFGVRVGGWFFSHAGNTGGRTLPALEAALRGAVMAHDYNDPEIVGANSILEARDWWTASGGVVATNARALGVQHFVFGHTPSALGARGAIALDGQAALFRIDCGMSPGVDDSQGALLRVRLDAGHDVAEALTSDGRVRVLWRAP